MPHWYWWKNQDLILEVYVQPRSTKDEITGPYGDRLKVRITAPPIEGRANDHLQRFLAAVFGVPRKSVILLKGESAREKRLCILSPRRLPSIISAQLP